MVGARDSPLRVGEPLQPRPIRRPQEETRGVKIEPADGTKLRVQRGTLQEVVRDGVPGISQGRDATDRLVEQDVTGVVQHELLLTHSHRQRQIARVNACRPVSDRGVGTVMHRAGIEEVARLGSRASEVTGNEVIEAKHQWPMVTGARVSGDMRQHLPWYCSDKEGR